MSTYDFTSMFENHQSKFFGFCMKLTRNLMDAEDLMQEAFCKAFISKERFKPGTNFNAWFSSIIRNTFINDLRKRIVRKVVDDHVEDVAELKNNFSTREDASSNLENEVFHTLINKLSDDQKIPFLMHMDGFQYDEISAELNVPVGTIKSRIFYARNYLKKDITMLYNTGNIVEIKSILKQQ